MKKFAFLVAVIISLGLIPYTFVPAEVKPKIYFDSAVQHKIVDMINQSKSTFIAELYNFTGQDGTFPVRNALINARNRGVKIRLIVDNQGACDPKGKGNTGLPESTLELIPKLEIRWATWKGGHSTFHRKLALADNTMIFIGSTNWTNNGFNFNNEASIILYDKEVGLEIIKQFENDWKVATQNYDGSNQTPNPNPNPKPPSDDKDNPTVYITNTGSKYHILGCSYLSKSQIEIKLSEACAKGKQPCSKCNPPSCP